MDSLLPAFTDEGLLPPGDYLLSLDELRRSLLVAGPDDHPDWDAAWRMVLVDNLQTLAGQLWQSGIERIFVDGSFVEDKDHPNDVDGYFQCGMAELASGELQRKLNLLDPHKVWTWDPESRKPYRGYPKKQLPMWHVYRVELYPHWGQLCGIRDDRGLELEFPSAFRRRRSDGVAKGIIEIAR